MVTARDNEKTTEKEYEVENSHQIRDFFSTRQEKQFLF